MIGLNTGLWGAALRGGDGLGPELLSNRHFDTPTGWTKVDGTSPVTVAAGEAEVPSAGYAQQAGLVLPVGQYRIIAILRSSGMVQFKASFATGAFLAGEQVLHTGAAVTYSPGTLVSVLVSNPTAAKSIFVIKEARGTGGTLYLDSLSLRKVL